MLTKEQIEPRLRKTFAEQLGLPEDEITAEKTLDELGGDSLDHFELVMAVEDEFNIEIPDEEAEKITTLGAGLEFLTTSMYAKNAR